MSAVIAIVMLVIAIAVAVRWRLRQDPSALRPGHPGGPPSSPSEPERGDGEARTAAPRGTIVVLVHGIFGFGSIGVGRARVHYFRRVASQLQARGVEVHAVSLPMLGGVPARGLALLAQLDRLPRDARLVLVAHSLGGLDARWAIARGGLATRVQALVTIGTPHHGTPIADAFARGPAMWLRRAVARLGLNNDAVDWLTTERMAAFNRETPDVPGVTYACVVAASADPRRIHPLLRVTHGFLGKTGPSDGLVPARSQVWGAVIDEVELDHWAQVGWPPRHDAAAVVERALDQLRALPPGRPAGELLLPAHSGRS